MHCDLSPGAFWYQAVCTTFCTTCIFECSVCTRILNVWELFCYAMCSVHCALVTGPHLFPPELSASFKSGTSLRYTFKEPYELSRNSSALPSSIYSDLTLRGENVSLSFRTNQSPALLLYVSSYYTQYLALLINKHGEGGALIFKELVLHKIKVERLICLDFSLLQLQLI